MSQLLCEGTSFDAFLHKNQSQTHFFGLYFSSKLHLLGVFGGRQLIGTIFHKCGVIGNFRISKLNHHHPPTFAHFPYSSMSPQSLPTNNTSTIPITADTLPKGMKVTAMIGLVIAGPVLIGMLGMILWKWWRGRNSGVQSRVEAIDLRNWISAWRASHVDQQTAIPNQLQL
jgi:hypothetical protein